MEQIKFVRLRYTANEYISVHIQRSWFFFFYKCKWVTYPQSEKKKNQDKSKILVSIHVIKTYWGYSVRSVFQRPLAHDSVPTISNCMLFYAPENPQNCSLWLYSRCHVFLFLVGIYCMWMCSWHNKHKQHTNKYSNSRLGVTTLQYLYRIHKLHYKYNVMTKRN